MVGWLSGAGLCLDAEGKAAVRDRAAWHGCWCPCGLPEVAEVAGEGRDLAGTTTRGWPIGLKTVPARGHVHLGVRPACAWPTASLSGPDNCCGARRIPQDLLLLPLATPPAVILLVIQFLPGLDPSYKVICASYVAHKFILVPD